MEKLKIWTDDKSDKREIRGRVALPLPLKGTKCLQCNSTNLTGVLITESADEQDTNILCLDCGYWRD